MHIKVTFRDLETNQVITKESFNMEVPAALWCFLSEYEQKEYCVRSFFSAHNVQCEEVVDENPSHAL